MDAKSAARFKQHAERIIEEFLNLRASVGEIIARVDTMLLDNIYKDHPDLDGMKR